MKKLLLLSLLLCFSTTIIAQGNLGIVGTAANGWPDAANPTPDIMLTNNNDGTHSITGITLTTGLAKFRTDMDWANPNYGGDTFPSGPITNNDIPVQAGTYDILVDLNNNTYSFSGTSTFTDIELFGTALPGGAVQLSTTDGITYELGFTNFSSGDLQFREIGTSTVYSDSSFPTGIGIQNGSAIPMPGGDFIVTFNLSTGDYTFAIPSIGIVGPAANGWPDMANPTPDIMLTNNNDGTHSINGITLTTGLAKFRTEMDWANPNYGGDTFPSGPITGGDIPVQAGVYDILVDLNNSTYSFTDVSTFPDIELFGTALPGGNVQFSTIDGINYEATVTNFVMGDIQFQEVGTSDVYGASTFPTGTATLNGTAIPVPSGYFSVNFNLSSGDYTFSIPNVGIVGPAVNGWPDASNPTPDVLLNTTDGDTYTLNQQVLSTGELKFRQNQDWNVNWGGTAFPSGTAEINGTTNIPATAGTFDVVFSRSAQTYAFNATASVEGTGFDGFKVYPNPSSTTWVFQNVQQEIEKFSIFDQSGKLIYEAIPNRLRVEVNAEIFGSGIYLAQLKLHTGEQKTVKLVKK